MEGHETNGEERRLAALRRYRILDTPPEQEYEDATLLASQVCATPISLVTLLDDRRQWFKSRVGLDIAETPREVAFCAHAIERPDEVFVIPDARGLLDAADAALYRAKQAGRNRVEQADGDEA